MEWIDSKVKPHPDGSDEHIPCVVLVHGQTQVRMLMWNPWYEVWDDESGDDFYCRPAAVAYWMPIPDPPKQ